MSNHLPLTLKRKHINLSYDTYFIPVINHNADVWLRYVKPNKYSDLSAATQGRVVEIKLAHF